MRARKNPSAEVIAEKIIEYTQRGVRTPTALYFSVMSEFTLGEYNRASSVGFATVPI